MRKTKIVCTIGPASDSEPVIRSLIQSGMNVARFNFSHGTHESHLKTFQIIRRVREELNLPVATLLDTKGPEVRLGKFENGTVELMKGATFILTTEPVVGNEKMVSVSYPRLPEDLKPGDRVLIDDGLIELKVLSIDGARIECIVQNPGVVKSNKGVNLPGVTLSMPYISDRDRADIAFGVQTGFDFIAASFTRSADDILQLRELLSSLGGAHIKIIAKIENADGVNNIDDILRVSDGAMIARGDMGVEIPLEDVPVIQKLIIKKVLRHGKHVITATQMLESMTTNPRPTRAEAADVANAIYDGTSAIMLSGETAAGQYPVLSVQTMATIAERTENDINYLNRFLTMDPNRSSNVTAAIAHATVSTANELDAAAIIAITTSGTTARAVSRFRPFIPIVACVCHSFTYRQLALSWGVTPVLIDVIDNTDELIDFAVKKAHEAKIVHRGDLVVIAAGLPTHVPGSTNLLKVHIVGDTLVEGTGIGEKVVSAPLCVAKNEQEALLNFKQNDILVMSEISETLSGIIKKASGLVLEQENGASQAALALAKKAGIPVLTGARKAMRILKSGTVVTLDPVQGVVRSISRADSIK